MVKPFSAGVGSAAVDEAVTDEAAPLSPSLVSPALASITDDASSEVAPLAEFPPKLKEQPARAPNERMETNKVFLFIFVFAVKTVTFLSLFVRFMKATPHKATRYTSK